MPTQTVTINGKPYDYVGFGELGHVFHPQDGCSPIIRTEEQIAHFNLTYFPGAIMTCGFNFPESVYA